MSIPLLDGAVAVVYPSVTGLATTLSPIGGAATATAVCTTSLRLPLTSAGVRGERSRAALAPRVSELHRRHAKDPGRLHTELAKLTPLAAAPYLVTALSRTGVENAVLPHGLPGAQSPSRTPRTNLDEATGAVQ